MTVKIIEGDALAIYGAAKADPDAPPAIASLCRALIGSAPQRVRMVGEADIVPFRGAWVLRVHRMILPARAAWLVGHELAEWWYHARRHTFSQVELEARCDALGAALVAPRPAFLRALKRVGHRVHVLAARFQTTQALALLRVGEVTGRPVFYDGRAARLARGQEFTWPADPLALPRRVAHPIQVDGRWGMMAAWVPLLSRVYCNAST